LSEKIISRSELKDLGAKLRQQGQKIVLANGCFDLLHVGHVRYLQAARKEGDVLVVALNSDRAVEAMKGSGRPLLRQDARAALVAALACVDFVLVFDDLSAESVLRELRPHVHCKGTDYSEFTVPERQVMEQLGGTVRIVGDPKHHSTSDVLAEIRRRFTAPHKAGEA
jgi:D-glycero-beta-D-manno-heptose 1-phosphate adenylyltransferase